VLQLLKLGYSFLFGGRWLDGGLLRFGTYELVAGPVFALAISTAVVHFLAPGAFEELLLLLSAVFTVLGWLFHI